MKSGFRPVEFLRVADWSRITTAGQEAGQKADKGHSSTMARYLVDATAGYLNFFKWGSTNTVILERSDLLDPAHRDVIHLYPDPRFKSKMLKKKWVCCYKSVGAARGVGPLRLKDPRDQHDTATTELKI